MEATLGTLERYPNRSWGLAKAITGLRTRVARAFGCSHKALSRPFSRHGESYRVCIACGARRKFDSQTWNSRGPFYYKAANTMELLEVDCTAIRSV
jgi:hypothetical protein